MSERNVLLKNVKHPFLVGLHYSFQTADKLYFVLDYINGGEVCDFIRVVCQMCSRSIGLATPRLFTFGLENPNTRRRKKNRVAGKMGRRESD